MEYLSRPNLKSGLEEERLFRIRLDNGSILIGEFIPGYKLSMGVNIRVGSIYDPDNQGGLHHLLEHMLFKSKTDRARSNLVRDTEDTGGEANAYTSDLETEVYCTIPKRAIDTGLNFLTYLVGQPLTATPHDLGLERKVVLTEMDKYHDNPLLFIDDLIEADSFSPPFGNPVIGNKESVESITLRDLNLARERSYQPTNMIFSFVGDADPEYFAKHIEKELPKSTKKCQTILHRFNRIFRQNIYPRQGIRQATLGFSFNSYPNNHPLATATDLMNTFLTSGERSELYRELRTERGLIYNLSGIVNQTRIYGSFELVLATKSDRIEQVVTIILNGFKSAQNISRDSFERVKRLALAEHDMRELNLEDRRQLLLEAELAFDDAREAYNTRKRILETSYDEFVEAAHHALRHGYSSSFIVPSQ